MTYAPATPLRTTGIRLWLYPVIRVLIAVALLIAAFVGCVRTSPPPTAIWMCIVLGIVSGAVPLLDRPNDRLEFACNFALLVVLNWIGSQLSNPPAYTLMTLLAVTVTARLYFVLVCRDILRERGIDIDA